MEKEKHAHMKLYIPTNALDRDDLISGFGKKEFKTAGIFFGMCLAGLITIFILREDLLFAALVGAVLIMAAVVSLIWRDQCDESVLEKIRQIIAYQKAQKRYEYEYTDWLCTYMEEDTDAAESGNDGK